MNCQDITKILDERDISRLPDVERAVVEAHLSSCPACAAEWRVQQRLATGFAPPAPAGLTDRARALVAAGSGAAVHAQRARSRVILISTIVAVAAAAAWLGWQLRTPATGTAAIEEIAAPPIASGAVEAPPANSVQFESEEVDQQPLVSNEQPLQSATFTVRVLPVLIQGDSSAGNALVQTYRERLIVKLGKVPDLVLLDPVPRDKTDVADYDIQIRFKGDPAATTHGAEVDAGKPAAVAEMSRLAGGTLQDQFEYTRMRTQALSSRMPSSAARVTLPASVSFPTTVTLNESPTQVRPPGMPDFVDFSMDRVVQGLRVRVFPPNPSFQRELLAGVADPARTPGQRNILLGDLLSIAESHGGLAAVDAATIRAGAEFGLTITDLRTKVTVWESLRRTKHPELVQYLARGLESERETQVRLLMIQILSTDYSDSPQAQAVLQKVSVQEAEPVVRMAALREVQGEARWNEFAAATLRDASLPDLERLQPIADMADAGIQTKKVNLLLSDQEVRELASVIMRAGHDDTPLNNATRDAAGNSLTVLAAMENPAVRDVLIDILQLPGNQRGLAGISISTLKNTALQAVVARYPEDPKVRAAIEELASSSDSLASMSARTQLQMMDFKAKLETFHQQQPPQAPQPK